MLAPTILCAGIYVVLKHITLHLDPSLSRIRPNLYPLFFLPADITCLIVQGIGGGIAASARQTNKKLLDAGNRMIIAGITLQVVVLLAFGITAGEYALRVWRAVKGGKTYALWHEKKFRWFIRGVTTAYFAVFLRCVYR